VVAADAADLDSDANQDATAVLLKKKCDLVLSHIYLIYLSDRFI